MSFATLIVGLITIASFSPAARAEEPSNEPVTQVITEVKPFRTFLTIQKYNLENSGKAADKVFNSRIELTFPNGSKFTLPEGGHRWPISNGQSQEINRTIEIPWGFVQGDAARFTVSILRSGATIAPCEFNAEQLSQFNRGYICPTDAGIKAHFVQDNESKSQRGVLRGLHYQLNPMAQAKLVRVVEGEVLDVVNQG